MRNLGTSDSVDLELIICSEIIYRVLRNKRCIDEDTGEVGLEAFYLRESEDGLSICIASKCLPEECASNLRKHYGIVSLHAGRIRSLGLDVIHAPLDGFECHGLIKGLPFRNDNPAEAERFASLLCKQSRFVTAST
jgi:hypothetical protein